MEALRWTTATDSSRISRSRYSGSRWPSGRATTRVPPYMRVQKTSHTDTSKLTGVDCSTRSPGASRWSRCIHHSRFAMPAYVFTVPLGRPVEPEV